MSSRLEELNSLVRLRLRADLDPSLDDLHQFSLREIRPNPEEFDYIDREVALGRADNRKLGITPPPGKLPPSIFIEAFRDSTPLARIYHWFHKIGRSWEVDDRLPEKAYLMACLSEAAYLHLTDREVANHDRYQLYPSAILKVLVRNDWRTDIRAVFSNVADIPIEIIETRRFVYIVHKINQVVVIAVRGTAVKADWLINLNARKTDDGRFHRGFHDEADGVQPALRDAIRRLGGSPGEPLYFTGHSLGGAVACVLSRVWIDTQAVMTPYVFGAPRFATSREPELSRGYGSVAPYDLVPHVPPRWLGFANGGIPWTMMPAGTWHSVVRTTFVWSRLALAGRFAEPHSIEGYRANFGATLGETFSPGVYKHALKAD